MMGKSPYEDDEVTEREPYQAGKARTLSLVEAPPVLVDFLSRPVGASISRSVCSKLTCKQIESQDPSRGFPILKGTLFVRLERTSLEEVE